MSGHFLIIEARFYEKLADAQVDGAERALKAAGASWERISVPGALEIPAAIAFAESGTRHYDGYIALGCVIRGETTHYDIVCTQSARALMDLSVADNLVIGNGILTVENEDQAWDRADHTRKDKGGGAAQAALEMAQLKKAMALDD
ncbi:6,7-dimethyl-8-ribityllumazine synthase [Alphaproteobacteria bacterium]|jgi:6,7-dimethyl-8-ribityllumazine synthase|nr:6,7-dimethyl-8-ribityllumazine synthase [Alphaproteobacteria bacterium]